MNETDPKLSHQFALSFNLGNDRAMQINGVFARTDTVDNMNQQLDTLWNVCERLWARNRVEQLKFDLATAHRIKRDTEEAYQAAWKEAAKFTEARRQVPDRLKVDAETHIKAMRVHEEKIAEIEAALEHFGKMAA